MGRRDLTTTQNPDVEESQATLEILEGKKNAAQAETVAIAERRAQIEKDLEEVKKRHAHEHAETLGKHKVELETVLFSIDKAKKEEVVVQGIIEKTRHDQRIAEEDISIAHKNLTAIKERVERLTKEMQEKSTEVDTLYNTHRKLIESIALDQEKKKEVEESLRVLQHTVEQEKALLLTVRKEHDDFKSRHHATIVQHEQAKQERTSLTLTIDTAKAELSSLMNELESARIQLRTTEQKMAEESERVKREMGEHARLETRVHEKLEHLHEVESRFTTEHLARLGYQKLAE